MQRLLEGYEIEGKVLTAADYGVPQIRKRAILIGASGGRRVMFPQRTHFRPVREHSKIKNEWKAVKEVLLPSGEADESLFYSKKLIKGFKRRERINKNRGIGFRWQFLNPEKPSYTIPARYYKDGANALVKYSDKKIRMLDVKECAKIQSFPNDYIFSGSTMQIYKQIGNAVPPLMCYNIAKAITTVMKT